MKKTMKNKNKKYDGNNDGEKKMAPQIVVIINVLMMMMMMMMIMMVVMVMMMNMFYLRLAGQPYFQPKNLFKSNLMFSSKIVPRHGCANWFKIGPPYPQLGTG